MQWGWWKSWMLFWCIFHFRGGWVGTCSFPYAMLKFWSRPTHPSFPTPKGKRNGYAEWKNMKGWCNACNSKCHMQWPVWCDAAPPAEIELPFDRSRRKQVPSHNRFQQLSCSMRFSENQPNKLFDMIIHVVSWYFANLHYCTIWLMYASCLGVLCGLPWLL